MDSLKGKFCLYNHKLHIIVSYSVPIDNAGCYVRLEPIVEYRKQRSTFFGQKLKLPPIKTLITHIRILDGDERTIRALYS